ncbi:MAG TPA: DUF6194 family protein [Ktedonobacterales bacterium]|nr:DUF6194 family protein [Ktedonobacterales bacterium]
MDQDAIIQYITATFTGLDILAPMEGPGAGDTFIFYDPRRDIDPTRRQPFATIVTKDYGEFDNASRLDRPGVYRLNIGVSRETFQALFGYLPGKSTTTNATYDYTAMDRLMPHPVYAPQSFICVLNPSAQTFETIKPLLAEAYSIVAKRHATQQTNPE